MNDKSEQLKQLLLHYFSDAKVVSNGKEVVIRCRFCGDSQKDMSARHLYISLGDDDKPPMYHCFKCNESGILTQSILTQWNNMIPNGEIKEVVDKQKPRRYYKNSRSRIIYNIHIPYHLEKSDKDMMGVEYINKRLGLTLTYDEIYANKIILDPRHFLMMNKNMISTVIKIPDIDNYIGFLSADNSAMVLRDITDRSQYRYRHIRLVKDNNSLTYYCIPSQVNLMDLTNRVHIRIAEGVFDILGVCYNTNNNNRVQNVYLTSNGKDHMKTIVYAILGLGIINPIVDLYLDNDTEIGMYWEAEKMLNQCRIPIYYHYNRYNNEKDFGVPREQIVDDVVVR